MRVLMISIDRTLLGADYSGDAVDRHQIYAKLAGQLDIIVLTKKGFNKKKISPELTIYPTNSRNKLSYVFDAFEIAKKLYWPDKFNLVVTQDPFLNGLIGWIVKKRFKAPLLIHFHGDFWDNKYWLLEKGRWWFNWFFLLISKIVVYKADGIKVVSSGIKRKLVRGGVNKSKIRVIPTPIDLSNFIYCDPEKVRNYRQLHKNSKTIINVGRNDPSKDYKTLIQAIKLVKEKYGKIAFWQHDANLPLSNMFKFDENTFLSSTGKVDQSDLSNRYHASDVYVSSSKHESFGKVLVEAMAAGLPVVATNTTGSREIVIDGINGFLVPIGDSQALAKKILFLFNNPAQAKAMGQAGRKMVKEKFDQQEMVSKIIKFWKALQVKQY